MLLLRCMLRSFTFPAGQVNADYGVAGLCRELPARVEELVRRGGGKLRK